ncbi:hypothetical protein [Nocardia sp. CA-120079]|uniref:hypothetical protein n=1 Tax=Nocardia sp. CA-120079 TaxID=3239974 RepID=UPI003D995B3F
MRIRNNNHDHNGEDPDEGREPTDPKLQGEKLAEEVAEFLAAAVAAVDNPPTRARSSEPESTDRPVLRLVKKDATDRDDANGWDTPADPGTAIAAGRAARRRVARGAAVASALVVTATAFAAWGQPWLVAGPLAAYGTGWLAYVWWNAALRPSIPQVLSTVSSGVSTAFAVVVTTLAAIVRGLIDRLDTARTRHETTRTAPTTAP